MFAQFTITLSRGTLSRGALSKDALSKDALSKDALSKDGLSEDAFRSGRKNLTKFDQTIRWINYAVAIVFFRFAGIAINLT